MTKPVSYVRVLTTAANDITGQAMWGTVLLCLICSATVVGSLLLAGFDLIPIWAAGVANYFAVYAIYTVLHEAVHGNISGNNTGPTSLDRWVGRIAGFFIIVPYSAHETIHLTHHRYTNDPDRDPDHHVKGKGFFGILGRCMTVTIFYLVYCRRHWGQAKMRKAFWISLWAFVQTGILLGILGYFFGWQVPVIGYLIPAIVAVPTLAFLFDWIVHTPHEDPGRFRNTTVFEGKAYWLDRLYTWATLQQNYHGIHHAFPRIPFTKYRSFFKQYKAELIASGMPVKNY